MKTTATVASSELAAEYIDEDRAPENLTLGSAYRALWRCPLGHEYRASPSARVRGGGCAYCAGRAVLPGFNDLATTDPKLAAEWADARDVLTVSRGSKYRATWNCAQGHTFTAEVFKRAAGRGCGYCANKAILVGFNDLATTHPELAAELYDASCTAEQVTAGSARMLTWRCEQGHTWKAKAVWRSRGGAGCLVCANRVIVPGVNDLATTHPGIAAEMRGGVAPQDVVAGTELRTEWECSSGHRWYATVKDRTGKSSACPSCYSTRFVSRGEDEVAAFIRALLPDAEIKTTVRNAIPGELDILLPGHDVAIEFNGLFWHSETAGKGRRYHLAKTEACRAVGIQLIHVWEDDWALRRPIVERMLTHKLGVSREPLVPARKTTVTHLAPAEAQKFFESHHIQGGASGSLNIGLQQDNGTVVAAMTLKRNGDELRLERYATSCRVPGGHSKLIAYLVREIPGWGRIVTFADHSVSDGSVYRASGWVEDGVLPPDYMYVSKGRRHHKFGYRLSRFRDDPELAFVAGMSESQLAKLNKLDRVWDSGKTRFVYYSPLIPKGE